VHPTDYPPGLTVSRRHISTNGFPSGS
jgi:hypothetical protein